MFTRLLLLLTIGMICNLPVHAQTSAEQIINQTKSLLANGSYQQAYELISQQESVYSGEPTFDYYLGLAALRAGKAAEAVFALERALDIKPDFQQARAELGRAYYYLGENKAAKKEFENIKADSTTPGVVKNTIDKFLAAIDNRFDSSGKKLELYIEAALGSDSNVNSATDADQFNGTFFGTDAVLPIPEQNQETESTFLRIKPGVSYQRPIRDDVNFFASANYEVKDNQDDEADIYSNTTLNGSLGLAKLVGANQYFGSLSLQQFEIDGDAFRDQIALSGQWLRTLDASSKLVTYLQIATVEYDQTPSRDGSLNTIGVNWLKSKAKYLYTAGLYYGDEAVDDSDQQQQARDFFGIRGGIKRSWRRNSIFTNLTYQINSYKADDPAQQGRARDGDFLSFDIGIDIPVRQKMMLTPKLLVNKNTTDENLRLYDYDRTVLDISAKYIF